MSDEREARYAEAIHAALAEETREECVPEDFASEARAVMAVADAEQSELRRQVAAVEALADELEEFAKNGEASSGIGMGWRRGVQIAAHNLRERLASVGRTEPEVFGYVTITSDAEWERLYGEVDGCSWLWAEGQPWIAWCNEDGDWYALRPLGEDDAPTEQRCYGPVSIEDIAYPWVFAPAGPVHPPVVGRTEPAPEAGTRELRAALDWLADQMRAETGSDGWAESALIEVRRDAPTPDEAGAPNIGDTCCGKCPGDTCYVDQVTGA
jgi:hypothetical protein